MTGPARDFLSGKILVPLSGLRGFLRASTRRAASARRAGLRFRFTATNWGEEERREWILRRLRFTLRRAARETVYYQKLFQKIGFDPEADFGFEEFARLPVLEREQVFEAGRELVSRAVPEGQLRRDATGGSSGRPTEVWLGPEERGWGASGIEFFMRRISVPPGTRTAYLWGHHLDPVTQDSWRERYRSFESNSLWLDCFRMSPEILEGYHRKLLDWRPACVVAYASALGSFADYLHEKGYEPNYPTRAFVTGAEKLLPNHRELVENIFGKPVHERYGSRDVGGIAMQLAPAETLDYTVDWANVLLEPETGEEAADILVTKLHADGMPMIRYRVGDVGKFPMGSVPGHPAFMLREILGRTMDRIWLRDGRWISGSQFPHMLKDYPVREFMFLQKADYSVELKVVPKSGFGAGSREKILATVGANLPGLDVHLLEVESIPRTRAHKLRPVVSEVEHAGPSGEGSER